MIINVQYTVNNVQYTLKSINLSAFCDDSPYFLIMMLKQGYILLLFAFVRMHVSVVAFFLGIWPSLMQRHCVKGVHCY